MAKNSPKQKPKPSKDVLAMVKATKAKKQASRDRATKREDFSQAAARIVRQATED